VVLEAVALPGPEYQAELKRRLQVRRTRCFWRSRIVASALPNVHCLPTADCSLLPTHGSQPTIRSYAHMHMRMHMHMHMHMHVHVHVYTHMLTGSLAHWLTCSLAHRLTGSLAHCSPHCMLQDFPAMVVALRGGERSGEAPPPDATKETAIEAHRTKFGGGPPPPSAQTKDNPADIAAYDFEAWMWTWAVDCRDVFNDGGGGRR
jgi:hypothetical protein